MRLTADEAAGVDGVWVMGLRWAEVATVRAAVRTPMYASTTFMDPVPDLADLERVGVVMTTFHVERFGHRAQWDFFARVRDAGFDGGRDHLESRRNHPLCTAVNARGEQ